MVCAANGDVLAGSFGLALACDFVLAKESVRFGCPEINVGVFPFMISALIYRNVGRLKANVVPEGLAEAFAPVLDRLASGWGAFPALRGSRYPSSSRNSFGTLGQSGRHRPAR